MVCRLVSEARVYLVFDLDYVQLFRLFVLMLYVPINNLSHVETISCISELNHY